MVHEQMYEKNMQYQFGGRFGTYYGSYWYKEKEWTLECKKNVGNARAITKLKSFKTGNYALNCGFYSMSTIEQSNTTQILLRNTFYIAHQQTNQLWTYYML